jgi:zinc/manganese transport system substrate-binding protein
VDPAAKDLKNLIQQMRDGGVRVLFLENVSNPRLLNQIAKEGGGVIGGKLYSDALDAPNTPAGSYLGMVRSNVEVVAKALRAP